LTPWCPISTTRGAPFQLLGGGGAVTRQLLRATRQQQPAAPRTRDQPGSAPWPAAVSPDQPVGDTISRQNQRKLANGGLHLPAFLGHLPVSLSYKEGRRQGCGMSCASDFDQGVDSHGAAIVGAGVHIRGDICIQLRWAMPHAAFIYLLVPTAIHTPDPNSH
jgi:hypothetical protein